MIENIPTEFALERCCTCGVQFMIPADLQVHLKRNKQTFHCPNGHEQSYTKSAAEILQERLDANQKRTAEIQAEKIALESRVETLERRLKRKARK